jgi:hypothetical protein
LWRQISRNLRSGIELLPAGWDGGGIIVLIVLILMGTHLTPVKARLARLFP